MTDFVSVIVPSAGRRLELLENLLSVLSDEQTQHETIIVVPPDRPLSRKIRDHARVVEHPGPISVALNAGIQLSRGTIVAVTHDDCTPQRGWLRELISPIQDLNVAASVGQSLPSRHGRCYPNTSSLSHREPRVIRANGFRPLWDFGFVGNNFAIRRDVFDRTGFFNEALGIGSALRGGEDLDMFHRILAAGLTICVNPRAILFHEPLDSWQEVIHMSYTYRIGLAAYFWCHRREPDVGDYFLHNVIANQIREVWRSARNSRAESLTVELAGLSGLAAGLMKSWLYRL